MIAAENAGCPAGRFRLINFEVACSDLEPDRPTC
jgi:hypothetical protein